LSIFEEQTSHYLRELRGKDHENAQHSLIELGADVIPLVTTSFRAEADSSIRSMLVNIAWRTNSPRALSFLKEALDDEQPDVWKEALDGLIAFGGQSALDVVRHARARANAHKSEWFDEAIQQINDAMSGGERSGQ
jgi:HEAT repeat protein